MKRRNFLKAIGLGTTTLAFTGCLNASGGNYSGFKDKGQKPNVLFIAFDDLNDWTGCLGGYPGVITPNIDRLARRGVLFTHAYCAAPACNPSRAALMTGIRPSTSGVYKNPQPWRQSPILKEAVTLPQHFMAHGYRAMGSGKIFHGSYPDPASWNEYWPSKQKQKPNDPVPPHRPLNGIPGTAHFDWGPLDVQESEMGDVQVANWVCGQLHKKHEKPFFLACGFFRPHLPWYVPQKYFDMYPLDKITLPNVKENDLDDVPTIGRRMAGGRDHKNVTRYNQWRQAVRGYLASITFADACFGKVLDALDNSPYAKNTIIVTWSDHGWHLGEKLHWRKFALWEEATHNPLMYVVPGLTKPGGRCSHPVSLMDIYPTLVELCGLSPREVLDGVSLVPLLKSPNAQWDRPALTTYGKDNHSLRSPRWRYIRYADGTEELYDHNKDEMEWYNLADKAEYEKVKKGLTRRLPRINAENSTFNRKKRTTRKPRKL